MLCIGVLGDHLGEKTIGFISRFYQLHGKKWVCVQGSMTSEMFYKTLEEARLMEADAFFVALNEKTFRYVVQFGVRFRMLLYLSGEKKTWLSQSTLRECLDKPNVIIVNSDDKRIFPLMLTSGSMLITCGMNSKASVTISSVTQNMGASRVVCCLQRGIRSLSGNTLEPQEFAVEVDGEEASVSGVLAALTTLMAGDVEIGEITDFSQIRTSKEKIFE